MREIKELRSTDPRTLGPYRLAGRLGTGGQGTVYVGAVEDGPRVAVKVLHPHLLTDDRARARFLREADLAKRVAPYCTAQVLHSGVEDDRSYIVSEYVDGPSLQESVRSAGPRGGAALQRLAINTVAALAAIHRAGIVHRDFKPGNVLLGPDGPVVIDFGVSRALDLTGEDPTSQIVGTPSYMAPEQLDGGDVGTAADLFAWGATMVFAATGERAFGGDSIPRIHQAVLTGEPPDLSGLDPALGAIVRACLSKDPTERPTAEQVEADLRALPGPAWDATRDGPPEGLGSKPQGAETRPDELENRLEGSGEKPAERKRRQAHRALVWPLAAAVAVIAAIGLTYSIVAPDGDGHDDGRSPSGADVAAKRALSGSTAGTTPTTSASPKPSNSSTLPKNSRSAVPGPGTTERPPSATPKSSPRGGEDGGTGGATPPPAAAPKRIGSFSESDVDAYCKSRGYDQGEMSYQTMCLGSPGKPWDSVGVSGTSVCRWKYARYPRARVTNSTVCMSH